MNILLIINKEKIENVENYKFSNEVINYLNEFDVNIFIEKSLSEVFPKMNIFTNQEIDFALVLGGDGTLLMKLHEYNKDYKYFMINLGRVGSLAEGSYDNYKDKLNKILSNEYIVEKRNVIEYDLIDDTKTYRHGYSYNEVSITRGKLFKMLLISLYLNNKNRSMFYADGVIVATTTGSTAFSMSCGGPLLLPESKSFVITPIAPQLRTTTSVVVNDTDKITLDLKSNKIESFNEKPLVIIDGKIMYEINNDTIINIYKANKTLNIIRVDDNNSLLESPFKVAMSSRTLF